MSWLWVQKKEKERKKEEERGTNPTSHALQAQKQPHSYVKTQSTITTSKYQNKQWREHCIC